MKTAKFIAFFVFLTIAAAPFSISAQPQTRRKLSKIAADEVLAKKRLISAARVPIILIHGVGGSDLEIQDLSVRERKLGLLDDGFPNDVLKGFLGDPHKLQFTEAGEPAANSLSARMAARQFYDVPSSRDITDLSKALQREGFVKNENLFEFAYDFRRSVPEIAELLRQQIDLIKLQTGRARVDIIAHSMGGMVAKQYLFNERNQSNVKTVIFVGTPHLGAPKALKALRYGDDLDVSLINPCKLKRAVHNMPSMFNLLPGKRYFEIAKEGYFEDAADIDGDGERGVLDYEKTLFNLDRGKERLCRLNPKKNDLPPYDNLSANLIAQHTDKFHEQHGAWKKPANVSIFAIAGYGVSTVKGFKETTTALVTRLTTAGDGTVPLWSAETVDADAIYYVNLRELIVENKKGFLASEHSEMIAVEPIFRQINQLLINGAGVYDSNFSLTRPTKFVVTETEIPFLKK